MMPQVLDIIQKIGNEQIAKNNSPEKWSEFLNRAEQERAKNIV